MILDLPWRQRLHAILFEDDSPVARRLERLLIFTVLVSFLVVILDSVDSVHAHWAEWLELAEWVFTGLFLLDYLLRLGCAPQPLKYAFSFFGLVDLMAVLPGLVTLFWPEVQDLQIVRILRVLRIFTIFKLGEYNHHAHFLFGAIRGIRQKIVVFLVIISALVTVFGALMYAVEGPESGFTSIPRSIYWAVVTMTTVGYGDITPHTALGQGIATIVMILGSPMIAIPTGIFTSELMDAMQRARAVQAPQQEALCPHCGKALQRTAPHGH